MREVMICVSLDEGKPSLTELLFDSALSLSTPSRGYNFVFAILSSRSADSSLLRKIKSLETNHAIEILTTGTAEAVRNANLFVAKAIERGADLIIVDPEAVLFADTIDKMLEAAQSDPMIGFVSPRLNDKTISGAPMLADNDDPSEFYQRFRDVAARLPEVSYVPAVGPGCLYIKAEILQDVGEFDPIFAEGGDAQADLIMRANRFGYRAAVANRALAYFKREARHHDEIKNPDALGILAQKFGHYAATLERYRRSAGHRALGLISCLTQFPRPSIAFDLSSYRGEKSGTTEYGVQLIKAFVSLFRQKYEVCAICDLSAWQIHGFDGIQGLKWLPIGQPDTHAAVIRPQQPFDVQALALAMSRGAVVMISMLDTIGYDCAYLGWYDLERFWTFVARFSDAVVYISEFSRSQFLKRFRSGPSVEHVVCMPSTDIAEYSASASTATVQDGYVLIVGNTFAHKAVRETVQAIRMALPSEEIRVMGVKLDELPDIVSYESGKLDESLVFSLYDQAKLVVFPSHYEGFGFPVLNSLGHGKVIFARDLPVFHEIKERVAAPDNIHLFRTNGELIRQLTERNWAYTSADRSMPDVGWHRSAREFEAVLARALKSSRFETVEARLSSLDILVEAEEAKIIKNQYKMVRDEANALHQQVNALHSHAEVLRSQAEAVQQQLKSMHMSTSWRITAPLRKIKSLFKP